MELPKEFLHLKNRQKRIVLHLLKCLYSLKQAPKLCNDSVNATLTKLNFTRCDADQGSNYSRSTNLHQNVWMLRNVSSKTCQDSWGRQLQKKLLLSGRSIGWWWHSTFQSLVGSLMNAMIGTRPDIAYVIGKLSKCVSNPCKQHSLPAKRVLCYPQFTKDFHLKLTRGPWRHSETLQLLRCFLMMSRRWFFHFWIRFALELWIDQLEFREARCDCARSNLVEKFANWIWFHATRTDCYLRRQPSLLQGGLEWHDSAKN